MHHSRASAHCGNYLCAEWRLNSNFVFMYRLPFQGFYVVPSTFYHYGAPCMCMLIWCQSSQAEYIPFTNCKAEIANWSTEVYMRKHNAGSMTSFALEPSRMERSVISCHFPDRCLGNNPNSMKVWKRVCSKWAQSSIC